MAGKRGFPREKMLNVFEAVSYQPSDASFQPSAISHQLKLFQIYRFVGLKADR
jgi:hypothetical protein